MKLPSPLDIHYRGARLLNDQGITQAIAQEIIKINPQIDFTKEKKRLQPGSLDVKIHAITDSSEYGMHIERYNPIPESLILQAKSKSEIELTELIDFGQVDINNYNYFVTASSEARSSVRKLGCFIPAQGRYFFSNKHHSHIEICNNSKNDIQFAQGERIAQLLFYLLPFRDYEFGNEHLHSIGEQIRALPMGVEITDTATLKQLAKEGFLKITPQLESYQGMIVVHASEHAYRLREIGTIDFSKRDTYTKEDLLEPIDITKGYVVKEFEHIIVDTEESFDLSPHIAIRFWDNIIIRTIRTKKMQPHMESFEEAIKNIEFANQTDGWIDQNYKGSFSRQPKWFTGRTIRPGQPLGFGQVFYYPTGVDRKYGTSELGSQYQHATTIRLGTKT